MIDTPLRTVEKPRCRGFYFDRDYRQTLQPAAMDSELLCWLPTPDATLAPPLPEKPFIEPDMVAVLVTGAFQPFGV